MKKKLLVGISLFTGSGLMSVGVRKVDTTITKSIEIKPRKKRKGGK